MTTDYNLISKQYQKSKEQPWRWAVESYSLMGLVGDLTEKSVVDVACGEGYFTGSSVERGRREFSGLIFPSR